MVANLANPGNSSRAINLLVSQPGIVGLESLQANRARAIDLLNGKLDKLARFNDALAHRQRQIATALVRLGRADRVWPLLKHSDDPSVRTELIHDLAKFGVRSGEVIARLKVEPEVSARRALVLALGEYPADKVPAGERGPGLGEAGVVL